VAAASDMPIQSHGKACVIGAIRDHELGNAFLT
jgi:hypothetical protein